MNSAVDGIIGKFKNELKTGSFYTLKQVRKSLIESGMYAADASAIIQALSCYLLDKTSMPPVTKLELNVTENCNLRCDYCFVEDKNNRRISFAVAKKAVDFLMKESKDQKDISILFFGGEPLLEFSLIKKTVVYSEKKALQHNKTLFFSMTTNGTLLDEEKLSFFRGHGIKFLLSLDGKKESHDKHRKMITGEGTFDNIMRKFPLFKKYQRWQGAKMSIMPDTVQHLYENIKFLHAMGVNQFLFGPADGIQWSQETIAEYKYQLEKVANLYKELRSKKRPLRINFFEDIEAGNFFNKSDLWGCRAGRQSLSVNALGEIYPCSKMYGNKSLRKNIKLGNLRKGITDPYLRMHLIGMLPVDRKECLECGYSSSCSGGCFAANFSETGNMFKPDHKFDCAFMVLSADLAKSLNP